MATIKDVAKDAGVSLGTVSKVINGIHVQESYRKRVEASIQKLNYTVNMNARSLKAQQSNHIVVIVPSIVTPFFAALLDHIESELNARGKRMLLCVSRNNPDKVVEYIEMAVSNKVDGIFGVTYSNLDNSILKDIPMVALDRHFHPSIPCIASDNYAGGRLAAKTLSQKGCKKLLCLYVGSDFESEPQRRIDGFSDYCLKENIPQQVLRFTDCDKADTTYMYASDSNHSIVQDVIHSHTKDGHFLFDGIFASSDHLAIIMKEELQKAGIMVPGDVQIIGFDGVSSMNFGYPVISSIQQPVQDIAKTGIELLFRLIDGKPVEDVTNLPIRFIEGGSTILDKTYQTALTVTNEYLYIPINIHGELETLRITIQDKTVMELDIPYYSSTEDTYPFHYYAALPVKSWIGHDIVLSGKFYDTFWDAFQQKDSMPEPSKELPFAHFAAYAGWINDPNGLIYEDGIYHMFFQYNAFGKQWGNMSWGHATSKDLIHWSQQSIALLPDENGTIYSGCAIKNTQNLLGLPKDALLFFYTAAGGQNRWSLDCKKQFTQRLAYSTDHGCTLHKYPVEIIPNIINENRDPKVYWHEASKGYYMSLFLDKHDYAILRSTDLEHWDITQKLTLKDTWECPDFREIPTSRGDKKWLFFTANGEYFTGDFDGYTFQMESAGKMAYKTDLAYAGQTFSGIDDRVVLMHWFRSKNPDKLYTGTMGIPRELELVPYKNTLLLAQHPVREWNAKKQLDATFLKQEQIIYIQTRPAAIELSVSLLKAQHLTWNIFGNEIEYSNENGIIRVNGQETEFGKNLSSMQFIIDKEIIELSAKNDTVIAFFETTTDTTQGQITITADREIDVIIYSVS